MGTLFFLGVTGSAWARDYALTVYGGRVTEDPWVRSLLPNVRFTDTYIRVAALARTIKRRDNGAFTLEIEGQVAK